MSVKTIEKDFIDKVSAEIQLSADGKDRFPRFYAFPFQCRLNHHLLLARFCGVLTPTTLTAKQYAHSALIHAICIPNLVIAYTIITQVATYLLT